MRKLMMKTLLLLMAMLPGVLMARDYQTYYQNLPVKLAQPQLPVIPSRTVNLRDVGGTADGVTLNTDAIRKAISLLGEQGGGRLVIPQGIWLTGPIQLQSHVELCLEKNAILYFSPDKQLYLSADKRSQRVEPCIKAVKCTDVAITGEGVIDGNGAQWRPVKRGKVSDVEWKGYQQMGGVERKDGTLWYPWQMKSGFPDIAKTPERQELMRNDLVRFTDCRRVLFKGVTFQNAPKFHVHPCYCSDVTIDGIMVRCPWNAQNGDAIDLSDCQRCLVVESTVDAGDDGICLKSGLPRKNAVSGCEDILVENNTVFHAHGAFVLGSETAAGVRRVVVRHNRFCGTDTGLRFKSGMGRGGKTEQLYVEDIVMSDIKDEAIIFQCDYVNRSAGQEDAAAPVFTPEQLRWKPDFQDIHIRRVTCRGAKTGIRASGIKGVDCVHDIHLSDIVMVYDGKGQDIDQETAKLSLENVKLVKNAK